MPGPGEHLHADALRDASGLPADRSKPHDAEGLPVQLGHETPRPGPLTRLDVDPRDLARDREHQRQGMLGHRDGRDARRVGYANPMLPGGLEVDVIGPRPPERQNLQLRTGGEDVRAELDRRPDVDDGFRVTDAFHQHSGRGRQAGMVVHLGPAPQGLERRAGSKHRRIVVRHDDFRAIHTLSFPLSASSGMPSTAGRSSRTAALRACAGPRPRPPSAG